MSGIKKFGFCFFVFVAFSICSKAQVDSLKAKYKYLVCEESNPSVGPGQVWSTDFFSLDDENEVGPISGQIVDDKGVGIPFAMVKIQMKGGKTFSCQTDLEGHYKFENLVAGNYCMTIVRFGYNTFVVDSILLEAGERQEIIIDMGGYNCLKTKIIYTNVKMKEGEYQPEISGK